MDLENYTSRGLVHQWGIVSGEPRCTANAIPPTDPSAPMALGRNAMISVLLSEVAAYETASYCSEPSSDDEDHEELLSSYHEAQAIVNGAGSVVKALARIRAGVAEEGDEEELAAALASAQPIQPIIPPQDTSISWLQFLALFTQQEVGAIVLSTNPSVAVFRFMASGLGGDMHLDDHRISQGLDALISASLISEERKAKVLRREVP